MPFIFALFFYILTINLLGIIPGFMSATSTLDLTLALAFITFLYVQFWGVKNLGMSSAGASGGSEFLTPQN